MCVSMVKTEFGCQNSYKWSSLKMFDQPKVIQQASKHSTNLSLGSPRSSFDISNHCTMLAFIIIYDNLYYKFYLIYERSSTINRSMQIFCLAGTCWIYQILSGKLRFFKIFFYYFSGEGEGGQYRMKAGKGGSFHIG